MAESGDHKIELTRYKLEFCLYDKSHDLVEDPGNQWVKWGDVKRIIWFPLSHQFRRGRIYLRVVNGIPNKPTPSANSPREV